jgi:NAD(P)H-dependent FMN reductase
VTFEPSRVLAVSGSLRATSKNTALLEALGLLVPLTLELRLSNHIAALPHFNPDLEDAPNAALEAWRAAVRGADIVLISSPEYAHGIPGALKNALDWCVGSGEFVGKPVKLLNASGGGAHAQAQLREVLRTMDARVLKDAQVIVPGAPQTAAEIVGNAGHMQALLEVLRSLEAERARG